MNGISYVTLCLAADESPHVSVSLYPDADARFFARLLPSGVPHLNIQHGDTEVTLWPQGHDGISGDDLTSARRMAEAATAYLELCERVRAESAT